MDLFIVMLLSTAASVLFFGVLCIVGRSVYNMYQFEEQQNTRLPLPVRSVILVQGEPEIPNSANPPIDIAAYRNNTVLPITISPIDYKDAKYIVYATIV